MNNKKIVSISIIVLLLVITAVSIFISDKKKINIGFVASFAEISSEVGIQGRNAVQLAIEEINSRGGIRGKKINMITVNTENSTVVAEGVTRDILEFDLSVLIGPLISRMGAPVIKATKGKDILVISPSIKSDEYSDIDDHFIKVNSTANTEGRSLADGIISRGDKKIALLWSKYNYYYTKSVSDGVKEKLLENSLDIVFELEITGTEDITKLVNRLIELEVDAVSIITKGDVAARITQQFYISGFKPNFYGCEWAKNTKILEYGGRSVNGMMIYDQVSDYPMEPLMKNFKENYKKRFFIEPTTTAILTYDSVMVFYQAMLDTKGSDDYQKLKEVIISGRTFGGLTEGFHFNSYGDVVRERRSLFVIDNNEYIPFE